MPQRASKAGRWRALHRSHRYVLDLHILNLSWHAFRGICIDEPVFTGNTTTKPEPSISGQLPAACC